MNKLDEVGADDLRRALSTVESAKAAKRLMVALAYKDGVSVSVLARRYDIPRSTLYYWLDRFEEQSIDDAIEDEPRPGRPPKLSESGRRRLRSALDRTPAEFGYGADSWTPSLVTSYVEEAFGVSYSEGHVRRLMRELG